jgi:hypothetical protein
MRFFVTEREMARIERAARNIERAGIRSDLEYFSEHPRELMTAAGAYPKWVGHGALSVPQIYKAIELRRLNEERFDG